MSKQWFYGIEGIEFIWRGSQSDPLVGYKGYEFNYWDYEDALYSIYEEEEHPNMHWDFPSWVKDNEDIAKGYLDDWIWSMEQGGALC